MRQVLSRFFRRLHLTTRALVAEARVQTTAFGVRPADPALPLEALSGGNSAREQIFAIIRDYAARGGAVLCLSGEHEQLERLCGRVLIFRRGRIAAELADADVTRERIAHECLGADLASAA